MHDKVNMHSSHSVDNQEKKINDQPFFLWKHLNKLRWLTLSIVFMMLILIPLLSTYQHFVAAQGYRNLSTSDKLLFDTMEFISAPFVNDAENDLDLLKGTTWSGQLFGLKLTDPLAVVAQISAGLEIHWPFILTALIPILLTIIFGRFFCGWICPATFLYELNSNVSLLLTKIGIRMGNRRFNKNIKYLVLAIGVVLSMLTGSILFAGFYPPAVIGRELYFSTALSGFGSGSVFIILTLLFDSLVSRRGFCRYLCPGGALYSLLGRYRIVRIKRIVKQCNDCNKCNAICEFDLNPMADDFGQECNNCTACIAVCPTNAMTITFSTSDLVYQGHGHLGRNFKQIDQQLGKKASTINEI